MYRSSYQQETYKHHSESYQQQRDYYYQQNQGNRYGEYQREQFRQNRGYNQRRRSYHDNKENKNDPRNLDYYMATKDETDRRDSWSSDDQRRSYSPRRSRHDSRRDEHQRRGSPQRKYSRSPKDNTASRSSRRHRSRSSRSRTSRSPSGSRRRTRSHTSRSPSSSRRTRSHTSKSPSSSRRSRKTDERSRSKSSTSSRSASVTSATSDGSTRGKMSPEKNKINSRGRIPERASEYRSKRPVSVIKKVYRKNFFQSNSRNLFDKSRYTWKRKETKVEVTIGDLTMSPISSDDFSQRSEEAESEVDKEETDNGKPHSNGKVDSKIKNGNIIDSKKTKEVKPIKELSDRSAKNDKISDTTEYASKKEHKEERSESCNEMANKCLEMNDVTQSEVFKHEVQRNVNRKSPINGELKGTTNERKSNEKCHSDLKKSTEKQKEAGCGNDKVTAVRNGEGSKSAVDRVTAVRNGEGSKTAVDRVTAVRLGEGTKTAVDRVTAVRNGEGSKTAVDRVTAVRNGEGSKTAVDRVTAVRNGEGSKCAVSLKGVKNSDLCGNTNEMVKGTKPKLIPSNDKTGDTLQNTPVTDNNKEDIKNKTVAGKVEKLEQKKKGTVEELEETLRQTRSIPNEMIFKIVSLVASKSKNSSESDMNINRTQGRKEIKTSEKSAESNKDENLIKSANGKQDQKSKDEISRKKSKCDEKVEVPKDRKDEKSTEKNQNKKLADANKHGKVNGGNSKLLQEKGIIRNSEQLKKSEKQKEYSNGNRDAEPVLSDIDNNKKWKEQKQKEKAVVCNKSSEKANDKKSKEHSKEEILKERNPTVTELHDKGGRSQTKSSSDEVHKNVTKHRTHERQFSLPSVVDITVDPPFSPELKESPPPYFSQSSVQNKNYYFGSGPSGREQQNKVPQFDLVNTRYRNRNEHEFSGSSSSKGRSSDKKEKEGSRPVPTDLDQSRSHTLSLNEKKKCFEARIRLKERSETNEKLQVDSNEQFSKDSVIDTDPFRDKEYARVQVSLERFDKSSFPLNHSPLDPPSTTPRERRLSGVVETNKSNTRKRHGSESSSPAIIKGTMNRPSGDVFIPLGKPSEKKRRLTPTNPARNPTGHITHASPGCDTGDNTPKPVKEKETHLFVEMKNKREEICSKGPAEKALPEEETASGPKRSLFGKNKRRISHFSNSDNDAAQKSQVVKVTTVNLSPRKSPASKRLKATTVNISPHKSPASKLLKATTVNLSPHKSPASKRLKHPFKQFPINKYPKPSPMKMQKKEVNLEKKGMTKSKETVRIVSHNSTDNKTNLPESQVILSPVDNIFDKMKETPEEEKSTHDDKSKTATKRTHEDKAKTSNEKRRKHEESIADSTIKKDKNRVSSKGTNESKNSVEEMQVKRDILGKKVKHNKSEIRESIETCIKEKDDIIKLTKANKHKSKPIKVNHESKSDEKLDNQQNLKETSSCDSKAKKPKHVKTNCLKVCKKSGTVDSTDVDKGLTGVNIDKHHFAVNRNNIKKYSNGRECKSDGLQNEKQANVAESVGKKISEVEKIIIHTEVSKVLRDTTQRVLAYVESQKQDEKNKEDINTTSVSEFDESRSVEVNCVDESIGVKKDSVKVTKNKIRIQSEVKDTKTLNSEKQTNEKVRVGKKLLKDEIRTIHTDASELLRDTTQKVPVGLESEKDVGKILKVDNAKGVQKTTSTGMKITKHVGTKSPMSVASPKLLAGMENGKKDLKEVKVEKYTLKTKTDTESTTKDVCLDDASSNKGVKTSTGAKTDNGDIANQNTLKDCQIRSYASIEKSKKSKTEFDKNILDQTVKTAEAYSCISEVHEITHDDSESDMDDIEPIQMIGSDFTNDVNMEKSLLNELDFHIDDILEKYCDDTILKDFFEIPTDLYKHINGGGRVINYVAKDENVLNEKDTKIELKRCDISECLRTEIVPGRILEIKDGTNKGTGQESDAFNKNISESNKIIESTLKSPDRPITNTPRKRFSSQLEPLGKLIEDIKEVENEKLEKCEGAKAEIPVLEAQKKSGRESEYSDDDDDSELVSSGVDVTPTKTMDKSAAKTTEWLQRAKGTLKIPASLTKLKTQLHQSHAQPVDHSEISDVQIAQHDSVQQFQMQMSSTSYNQHQQKNQGVHETSAQQLKPVNQNHVHIPAVAQLQNTMEQIQPEMVQTTTNHLRQSSISQGLHQTLQFQPQVTMCGNKLTLQQAHSGMNFDVEAKSLQKSMNKRYPVNQPNCGLEQVHYSANILQIPHTNAANLMKKVPISSQNVASVPMFNPLTAPLMDQTIPALMHKGQADTMYRAQPPVNQGDYTCIPFAGTQSEGIPVVISECQQTSQQSPSTSNVTKETVNFNLSLSHIEMPGVQEPVQPISSTYFREPAVKQENIPSRGQGSRQVSDPARQLITHVSVEDKRRQLYRELCDLDNIHSGDDGLDIMLLAEKTYLMGITLLNKDILRLAEERCEASLQQGRHQQQELLPTTQTDRERPCMEERASYLGQLKR